MSEFKLSVSELKLAGVEKIYSDETKVTCSGPDCEKTTTAWLVGREFDSKRYLFTEDAGWLIYLDIDDYALEINAEDRFNSGHQHFCSAQCMAAKWSADEAAAKEKARVEQEQRQTTHRQVMEARAFAAKVLAVGEAVLAERDRAKGDWIVIANFEMLPSERDLRALRLLMSCPNVVSAKFLSTLIGEKESDTRFTLGRLSRFGVAQLVHGPHGGWQVTQKGRVAYSRGVIEP